MKALIVIAVLTALLLFRCQQVESEKEAAIANRPIASTTIRNLFLGFGKNQVRAAEAIKDKKVRFDGRVSKIDVDASDNPLLTITDTTPQDKPVPPSDPFIALAQIADILSGPPQVTARFAKGESKTVATWDVGTKVQVTCQEINYRSGGFAPSILAEACAGVAK